MHALQSKNTDNRKNTPTKYENQAEKTPTKHTMTCIYTFFLLPLHAKRAADDRTDNNMRCNARIECALF